MISLAVCETGPKFQTLPGRNFVKADWNLKNVWPTFSDFIDADMIHSATFQFGSHQTICIALIITPILWQNWNNLATLTHTCTSLKPEDPLQIRTFILWWQVWEGNVGGVTITRYYFPHNYDDIITSVMLLLLPHYHFSQIRCFVDIYTSGKDCRFRRALHGIICIPAVQAKVLNPDAITWW